MTLHLNLPDDLRASLKRRAADTGHASVEAYVETLIRADADSRDYGAPPALSFRADEDLERKLQEGIDSGPATEMTAADWAQLRSDLRDRRL